MKILKQERRGNSHFLEVEASVGTLNKAFDAAFKKMVKSAKIPGFRKGKIPRSIFEKNYGDQVLIQEGLSDAVNDAYMKAVQELQLEIIDFPKNVKMDSYQPNQPLVFTCEVDVVPEVKIGTYKGLGIQKATPSVSDDDVQAKISEVRDQYAAYEPSETPIAEKDIVSFHMSATIDGQAYERWTRQNMGAEVGRASFGVEVDAQLIGRNKGEKLAFSVTFAADFVNEEVAGKTVDFEIEICDNRSFALPDLTDEWVQKQFKAESVEKWAEQIRKDLESQRNHETDDEFHKAILDKIFSTTDVEIQPVLVEREIDRYIDEIRKKLDESKIQLESYLSMMQKTIDDIRGEYTESAQYKVKTELVLDAIAKAEAIVIKEEDLIAEVKAWNIPAFEDDVEKMRTFLGRINTHALATTISRRKAMEAVVNAL